MASAIITIGWLALCVGLLTICKLEVGPFLRPRLRSFREWWALPEPQYHRDLRAHTWPCTQCGSEYHEGMPIKSGGDVWLCEACTTINRIER